MLKAIIFDFNGIILDDERIHFRSMRDAVAEVGITVSEEEYWESYLPLDDERCLDSICAARAVSLTAQQREQVLRAKREGYRRTLEGRYPLFPGAADFVRSAFARYPLAVASGARREEIESTLGSTGLMSCFRVIVAAEDFEQGKPHPESFLLALARLNERLDGSTPVEPRECLVIEDSVGGVRGSRAAGMRCLAVSNTYHRTKLQEADRVVHSLVEVDLESLQDLFEG